jgi:hypothetical protein
MAGIRLFCFDSLLSQFYFNLFGLVFSYEIHHDYIELEIERQQGVRILTVYLYLNDVEAGGGTNFPRLNLTVMPKRGRALFWPSVTDPNPSAKDRRTDHQALPVDKGIKYGANFWYHLRDVSHVSWYSLLANEK